MTEPLTRALGGATPATLNREARTVDVVALSGLAPAVRKAPAPDGTRKPGSRNWTRRVRTLPASSVGRR
ncbi:hypothetical protein J2847_006791 [Azospirillum agricola]|uniref:hypothetical protein n=1 Tax=Azospirillum agricola TaxID=1720247 RepID=UPI001F175BE1|nr:hypothetical protein [Azospirillum agricola]MBP2233453.1 hypothetical protein [Azospirillum agricola]